MSWVGVDIGTSHVKAVAVEGHTVTRTETEPTPVTIERGGASRDADEVVRCVKRVISRVVAEPSQRRVAGISIASVGEEIVPVDAQGRPTGPVICWYDQRGQAEARGFEPSALHQRFPPDPTSSLFKLLWLRANRSTELEQAQVILDLGSYVLRELGAPPIMDWSHASRTAMFDPVATRWDRQTLDLARIDGGILPELVPSGAVVGTVAPAVADELGVQGSTLLVAGGHDHFVGAFGSGACSVGDFYLSAGTSEAHLVLTDGPVDGGRGIDQGRFVDDRHWYVHCAAPGGHLFGEWRGLLFGDDSQAVDREVGLNLSPTGIRVDLDTDGRAATLHDVPLTATRGLVMRAVVEGSAVASARVFARLAAHVPSNVEHVVVAGHASADPLWRSLRLGMIDRPFDVIAEREVTAIGAAMLARRGVTGDVQPFTTIARCLPEPADRALGKALLDLYDAPRPVAPA